MRSWQTICPQCSGNCHHRRTVECPADAEIASGRGTRTVRRRLDEELVRRGLVNDHDQAERAIDERRVTVDGAPGLTPRRLVSPDESLSVDEPRARYVSRGGDKLAAALDRFGVRVRGRRCLDVGASTGGFTDCLLQRGAAHVIAVDVGYGQLEYRLRDDDRVTVVERTNARELTATSLPGGSIELMVVDVSFISLRLVLAPLTAVADDSATAVVLVKPQFEADRDQVPDGGVVRSPGVWKTALQRIVESSGRLGWTTAGVAPSALVGSAGNVEFFLHLVARPETSGAQTVDGALDAVVAEAATRDGYRRRD